MKTVLSWMSITYQGRFAVPLFDLDERSSALQRQIYQAIHSRYSFALDAADTAVASGSSIRDKYLRFTLFRGNATIELTPTLLTMNFRNLIVQDIAVAKECIEATIEAMRETCSDANILNETISTSCSLNPIDGDAHTQLSVLMANNVGIEPSDVGATEKLPVLAVELENATQQWNASANVTVSRDRKELFAFAQTEYGQAGDRSLGDRIDQQYRIIAALLAKIQVQVEAQ